MGLMDRINQAKCVTGLHAGEWQWVAEGNYGNVSQQHVWTQMYKPGGNEAARMQRHCLRCNRIDKF